MLCPRCNNQVNVQKNTITKCQKCRATLMCVKINNKLVIEDVSKDKGEK